MKTIVRILSRKAAPDRRLVELSWEDDRPNVAGAALAVGAVIVDGVVILEDDRLIASRDPEGIFDAIGMHRRARELWAAELRTSPDRTPRDGHGAGEGGRT